MINLIYGVTGQTGSYLAEQLIESGQEVWGVVRRTSSPSLDRIGHIKGLNLIEGDVTDFFSVSSIINRVGPERIYNMSAQSHVGTSFKQPAYTFQVTAGGCLNILEAVRVIDTDIKILQASSSEMFGKSYSSRVVRNPKHPMFDVETSKIFLEMVKHKIYGNGHTYEPFTINERFQNEDTPFLPQSPYAIAKLAAHHLVDNYRDSYGLMAYCSICFNHESPRRGPEFVTRKITKWIGEFVRAGKSEDFPKLRLGNINISRDWGHARDYARAMTMILDSTVPDDYVVCTGETHTINDFLKSAFGHIGIENYMDYIVIDPEFFRPSDVEYLKGDCTKIQKQVGWFPRVRFQELVKEMVEADING